jgi:hypothetical protein
MRSLTLLLHTGTAARPGKGGCRFRNRVSYGDRLTCCDARCLTRCHLASVSDSCHFFRTSQTCSCGGYTSCSCRRPHACSSGTVFVAVAVDRGRCADQLDRRRGYARPAVGSRPRSRESLVAVNADALVRLTRAVLPAISPTPLRYRPPSLEPDHRDSNCGSRCEGTFVIVTSSPIAAASALNMAGPQWVYAIFHG